MSLKLIETEIKRLLSDKEPEVICISGHWGIGKTYAWNKYLKEAQETSAGIALSKYSYATLFGLNSLDELKYSIFENTVDSKVIGLKASIETFGQNWRGFTTQFGKHALPYVQQLPIFKNQVGGVAGLGFLLSVRDTLICMDDIERRGKGITPRDLLGLVSFLKEQRRCKIVLIFNKNALDEDDQKDFDRYFEKVIDVYLNFDPTPEESIKIALPIQNPINDLLAKSMKTLGISNIRVIKKIERLANKMQIQLQEFDYPILEQMIRNIVPLAWIVYEPEKAPTFEFLEQRIRRWASLTQNKEKSAEELAWDARLDEYGFTYVDDFDTILMNGIKNGYFDREKTLNHAKKLVEDHQSGELRGAIQSAWAKVHDSFNDNQEDVLNEIYNVHKQYAKFLDPGTLSGLAETFREFGRGDQFQEILGLTVAARQNNPEFFDLQRHLIGRELDEEVVRVFNEQLSILETPPDLFETLQRISTDRGWSPADLEFLSTVPTTEYYRVFKGHFGLEMRRLIYACTQFEKISSSTAQMQEIVRRAREALTKIGSETKLNARRVKNYGVIIGQENLNNDS